MMPSLARVVQGISLTSILLLLSCGGVPEREGVSPTQAHMFAHFDRAGEVHDALVRGELDRAKRAAEWIARHDEPLHISSEHPEFLTEMHGQAQALANSNFLKEASLAAAKMGQACGDCHDANEVSPRFLIGTAPPGGSGPQAEMARHVWASERMWEGLLGPGDDAWKWGAEALRSGWLDPREIVSNPEDAAAIRALIRHVYDLGNQAETAVDSGSRAALYGDFLNTCSECHRLTDARIR